MRQALRAETKGVTFGGDARFSRILQIAQHTIKNYYNRVAFKIPK